MSKEKLTNQLKNAYKQLEEEFKNKGRPNTIEDNNVDYDNCNIYAMRQKIANLEAKLAESNESHHKNIVELTKIATEKDKQIEGLKQQLAEWQDGTIICKWTDAENKDKELEHQLAEKEELIMFADKTIKGLVLAKEIDKISFAVEQLEKVKASINKTDKNGYLIKFANLDERLKFYKEIDNQIEELKKEMK